MEVNVFNFAENGERREDGEEDERVRNGERSGETMTTRRDENDGDLARLLSGPDQPASSFSTFYCRETRRLLRHESTTACGGMKSGGKRQHKSVLEEPLSETYITTLDENAG